MTHVLNIERPIFLHFLNREAAAAFGASPNENRDILAINTLTICHCSNFSVNISQMIEYSSDKYHLLQLLEELTRCGIITTTSHDTNIEEFIDSRQVLYEKVSQRYPMYFRDTSQLEKFSIKQNNNFSMTDLLRRDILDIKANELALFARHARQQDIARFRDNLDPIQKVAFNEKEQAITRANFAVFLGNGVVSERALDSAARIFSALYIEHYSRNNSVVTPTGLGFTGFVEDFEFFPHYDIPVLSNLLHNLGWQKLRPSQQDVRTKVLEAYGKIEHRVFVERTNAFVYACYEQVKAALNTPPSGDGAMPTARTMMKNLISHLIGQAIEGTGTETEDVRHFFLSASETIVRAARFQCKRNRAFKHAWESNMPVKHRVCVLFLTSTDVEDDAIAESLISAGYHKEGVLLAGHNYAEKYICGAIREVVHVRSSAGSVGKSGSELVSSDAIKAVSPDFVVAVGICFGLQKEEHKIGDVLVSEEVLDYELVRQEENGLRERGPRIPAGSKLLSAARFVRRHYSTSATRVRLGLLVSGLKLVDSKVEREKLKTRFPDALGGEMEASGIMAAATRLQREWIVVKAICDWAFAKRKKNQQLAAVNSSEFAVKVANFVMDAEARAGLE